MEWARYALLESLKIRVLTLTSQHVLLRNETSSSDAGVLSASNQWEAFSFYHVISEFLTLVWGDWLGESINMWTARNIIPKMHIQPDVKRASPSPDAAEFRPNTGAFPRCALALLHPVRGRSFT
ncbi:hypothetical protein TNCV_1515291 [Trichonephila clavipes]|nr:hypothetical protein TNCV_1515291 [Trichonephila clavipes]